MALLSCIRGSVNSTMKANLYKTALRQNKLWCRSIPASSMATMKSVSSAEHQISREEYFAKNERLNRPLSPHLTIYQLQMTNVLSITHRFTGVFLSGMLSGFAVSSMVLPGTFPVYLSMLQDMHMGPAILFAAKFALAWPFSYHILNGVRHLAWDMGYGFKMSELYKTGYTVVALSVVIATALSLI